MPKLLQVGHPAVVPGKMTTCVVAGVNNSSAATAATYDVTLDPDNVLATHAHNETKAFRWKSRQEKNGFVYIAEAWTSRPGRRHVAVKAHQLRPDGSFGGRIWILEKINGVEQPDR